MLHRVAMDIARLGLSERDRPAHDAQRSSIFCLISLATPTQASPLIIGVSILAGSSLAMISDHFVRALMTKIWASAPCLLKFIRSLTNSMLSVRLAIVQLLLHLSAIGSVHLRAVASVRFLRSPVVVGLGGLGVVAGAAAEVSAV